MGCCWQAFYWVVPRTEQGCSLSRSSRARSLAFAARGLMAPIARGHPAAPGWGFVVVGEIVARRSWRASADRPGPRSRSTSLETGSVPWWPHKAPRTASALPCSDRRSRGHRGYCRRPPPHRSRDMRPRRWLVGGCVAPATLAATAVLALTAWPGGVACNCAARRCRHAVI